MQFVERLKIQEKKSQVKSVERFVLILFIKNKMFDTTETVKVLIFHVKKLYKKEKICIYLKKLFKVFLFSTFDRRIL